jgi:phosphoglycerate dehydrogenase-like enzyme
MAPIVLVTEPEYRRGEPVFGSTTDLACFAAPPAEDALIAEIGRTGARHLVVGSVKYGDRLYGALPRGAVIARFGVGHDSIDKEKATAAGLLCTNTPHVLQQSVAELTMTMIGAAARHVVPSATDLVHGTWRLRQGIELDGKTLTLVGCGEIGRAVARIAAAGYGMRVVGYTRRPPSSVEPDPHIHHLTDDLRQALAGADFVSLHIPGSAENRHLVDAERLGWMPSRGWLINTARGAVVDEVALFDALTSGRIAGAALDVFEREPYEPRDGRDLRTLPNVLLIPHIGSHTFEANRRMAERALGNILLAEARDFARMDLLNPAVL